MNDTTATQPTNETDEHPNESEHTTQEQTPAADTTEDTPQSTEDQPQPRGNQEAAKYRVRLREAESQLESAQTQLEALQTSIVQGYAKEAGITRPEALQSAGFEPSSLFTADGQIDAAHARQTLAAFANEAGLAVYLPQPDPAQIAQGNYIPTNENDDGWNSAFKMR